MLARNGKRKRMGLFYGDALGKITRFIYITAKSAGDMVAEKLERDTAKNGGNPFCAFRDDDDVIADGAKLLFSTWGGDGDDRATAGADFFDGGDVFHEDGVVRSNEDGRDVFIDEGDDSVLELSGGVAAGEDVGNFLHFERGFDGGGIIKLPPEEEHSFGVCVFLSDHFDLGIELEDFANLIWECSKPIDDADAFGNWEVVHAPKKKGEQSEHRALRSE